MIARHFVPDEFRCRCGRAECDAPAEPEQALVALLDLLRDDVKAPLVITSGLRCRWWNEHEGGEPNSGHLHGTEADVSCPSSWFRYKLLFAALTRGVRRIGIGKDFLHLGLSTSGLPSPVVWTYYH